MNTVGGQIRTIRQERKKTLKEISVATGVSISFLSQLELNKTNATLETLKKISIALEVHPSLFFKGIAINNDYPFHYKDLSNGMTQASFKPMHVIIRPGENLGNDFTHIGHEFIYILQGELIVTTDGERNLLKVGDSIMIDTTLKHYWLNESPHTTEFLVITSI